MNVWITFQQNKNRYDQYNCKCLALGIHIQHLPVFQYLKSSISVIKNHQGRARTLNRQHLQLSCGESLSDSVIVDGVCVCFYIIKYDHSLLLFILWLCILIYTLTANYSRNLTKIMVSLNGLCVLCNPFVTTSCTVKCV